MRWWYVRTPPRRIKANGARLLAEAVSRTPQLREIVLDSNEICNVDATGRGEYTLDSLDCLCEALTKTGVTHLGCAALPPP